MNNLYKVNEDKTLDRAEVEKIPVYSNVDSAEADLENLNVDDIISVQDEVEDIYFNELKEKLESLVDGSASVPVGTIVEIPDGADIPLGYLLADGSKFDKEKYPILYAELGTDTLPEVHQDNVTDLFKSATATNATVTLLHPASEYEKIRIWGAANGTNKQQYFEWNHDDVLAATTQAYGFLDSGYSTNFIYRYFNADYTQLIAGSSSTGWSGISRIQGVNRLDKYKIIRAASSVSEDESEAVANAIKAFEDKVAYNGLPVGTVIESINHEPYGYLKCDGSEYDIEKYPALYAKLGTNVLPDLPTDDETLIYGSEDYSNSTTALAYPGSLFESITNFDSVRIYTIRADTPYPVNGYRQVKVRDLMKQQQMNNNSNLGFQDGINANHFVQFSVTQDGETLKYYNRDGENIYRMVGVGRNHKYIKAVTGFDDSDEEAQSIVQSIQTLIDRYAYNGLPTGSIIDCHFRPNGYIPADGTEYDTEKYPALYAILQSNKTPIRYNDEETILWNGNATSGAFTLSQSLKNFGTIRFETNRADTRFYPDKIVSHDTLMNAYSQSTDGHAYLFISDGYASEYTQFTVSEDGTVLTPTGTTSGQRFTRIVGIGRPMYIKAVSGLEETDEEAENLADAFNELTNKVAYNSLPLGTIIERNNNDITPAGYILCDGRDLTYARYKWKDGYYDYQGNAIDLPAGSTVKYTATIMNEANPPKLASINGRWYYKDVDNHYWHCEFNREAADDDYFYISDEGEEVLDNDLIAQIDELADDVTCEWVEIYPVLIDYLGDDKVPDIPTNEETVLWQSEYGVNGTVTLSESIFNFEKIRLYSAYTSSSSRSASFIIDVPKDRYEAWGRGDYSLMNNMYASEYRYYKASTDGLTITGSGGQGSWNGINKVTGIGRYKKYIKATTGLEDSPEESQALTDALNVIDHKADQMYADIEAKIKPVDITDSVTVWYGTVKVVRSGNVVQVNGEIPATGVDTKTVSGLPTPAIGGSNFIIGSGVYSSGSPALCRYVISNDELLVMGGSLPAQYTLTYIAEENN